MILINKAANMLRHQEAKESRVCVPLQGHTRPLAQKRDVQLIVS